MLPLSIAYPVSVRQGGRWISSHVYQDDRGEWITLVGARARFADRLHPQSLKWWSHKGTPCRFLGDRTIEHQFVDPPSPRRVPRVLVLLLANLRTIDARRAAEAATMAKSPGARDWMTARECESEHGLDRHCLTAARTHGSPALGGRKVRTKPCGGGHYLYFRADVERIVAPPRPYPSFTEGKDSWVVAKEAERRFSFPHHLLYRWAERETGCHLPKGRRPLRAKQFVTRVPGVRGLRRRLYFLLADLEEIEAGWAAGGGRAQEGWLPRSDAAEQEGVPVPTLRGWTEKNCSRRRGGKKIPSRLETRRRGGSTCRVRCVQADDVAAAAEGATSDGRADPYRDWPTEGEAARLAGLSETHLKRLRNVKGGIRAVKRTAWVGNRVQEVWRHSPEDLERWRTLRESPTKAPHTDEAGLWYPDRYLHENQGHGLTALHKLRVRLLAERSPLVKRIDRSGSGCRGGKLWVLHQDALGLLTASPAAATSPVPANVLQPAAESRTVPGGRPPEPLPQQPYPVYIIQPKDLPVPVQQVECSYPSERPRVDAPPPASRPRWDAARRELWYGKVFCKRYTRPAEHQTLVLDSFEELGWPERIDDPLPPGKLRATIDDLNRALAGAPLHFCGDGTGEGMRWGARPAGE